MNAYHRWVATRLTFGPIGIAIGIGIAVNHITPRSAALNGIAHGVALYRAWRYAQECVETAAQR